MSQTDDILADLLYRCALGDESALERLYRLAAPRLYTLALRLLKRRDLAEDTLQDAFVAIWRHAVDYRQERGDAMAWMARIVRNRALDGLRRADPQTADLAPEIVELCLDGKPNPEECALSSSAARALHACLERLIARQRQSIALAYFQGLSHEEVAQVLGEPLGTVKSWIRRGLEQLRRCLGQ